MASHASHDSQHPLDELAAEIRSFLTTEVPERARFMRLVELLHALDEGERQIAYGYLMHETTNARMSAADDERVRMLARLADFVGQEPPPPGTPRGAVLPRREDSAD